MDRPRVTASRATPAPTTPPPTTSTSSSSVPPVASVPRARIRASGLSALGPRSMPPILTGEPAQPSAVLVRHCEREGSVTRRGRFGRRGGGPGRRPRHPAPGVSSAAGGLGRHRPVVGHERTAGHRRRHGRRAGPRPQRRTATLVMGGDLLWHNTVWESAAEDHARTGRGKTYDFDPMFAGVRSLVSRADVALCHEEVPFAAPGQPPQNFPVFAAPPEVAPLDRLLRLRRLHDRLQPRARPGLRRPGAHRRPARPGRCGAHRDVPARSPSGAGR